MKKISPLNPYHRDHQWTNNDMVILSAYPPVCNFKLNWRSCPVTAFHYFWTKTHQEGQSWIVFLFLLNLFEGYGQATVFLTQELKKANMYRGLQMPKKLMNKNVSKKEIISIFIETATVNNYFTIIFIYVSAYHLLEHFRSFTHKDTKAQRMTDCYYWMWPGVAAQHNSMTQPAVLKRCKRLPVVLAVIQIHTDILWSTESQLRLIKSVLIS